MFQDSLLAAAALFALGFAQEEAPAPAPLPGQGEAPVSVPMFPNTSCPIMGKPISTRLYTDTELGRIYICCKSCVKDIRADVPVAYRTAYPTEKRIDNEISPVSGKHVTRESPTVVLQGFEFFVLDEDEATQARQNAQVVLATLHDPSLVDLGNQTCPVSREEIERNTIVVIEGTIIRLSSARCLDEVEKDPAGLLKKAKEIRAAELRALEAAGTPSQVERS